MSNSPNIGSWFESWFEIGREERREEKYQLSNYLLNTGTSTDIYGSAIG
jgi:hypothetical protein